VIAQGRDGAVYLPDRIEPGFRYRATSLLPLNSERPVARDVQADRANYLQLPAEYSPRIGELARQVSAHAASPFDKALALEAHLRTRYAYSFETIFTSQNVTPLEEFLFETRRGHCEFFASAMAIMLREIGIPSRVVHGYLAHGFNPVTGLYEVRAFDGHAWVEAYLEGSGWVSFEPTAAYPVPRRQQQSGTTLADLKTYAEKLAQQEAMQGEKSVLQIVADVLRSLTEAWYLLLFQAQAWFEALQAWVVAHALAIGAALSIGVLAGFAAYRQRVRLLWLWAGIVMRTAPAADVPLTAFRQLERVARARKLGKAAGETAEEYLGRLEQVYAELRIELRVLRRAFNARRYGGMRLKADDTQTVLRAFHAIGAAIKAR
jgi:protein-glutamine gamma-glutamyltransferase